MTESYLITGGCGFIGSHLADSLVGDGHTVRVLDNLTPQVHPNQERPSYLNAQVECVVGDVLEPEALSKSLAGIDVVVHFAAAVGVGQSMYEPERYVRTNSLGTAALWQQLIDSSNRPRKVIVASSMSVYGEGEYTCPSCGPQEGVRTDAQLARGVWNARCAHCETTLEPRPTTEAKATDPASVYALSKLDQEKLCLDLGRAYDVPTVALRFFNVYGPRQSLSNPYTGVAAIFSSRIRSSNGPLLYEDGFQQRDFVSVHDVVRACRLASESPDADFGFFNVGSGAPITIRHLAQTLLELHRAEDLEPELPGSYRPGDVRHCFADISKFAAIGYCPRVELADGLRELEEWASETRAEDHFEEAQSELSRRGLL